MSSPESSQESPRSQMSLRMLMSWEVLREKSRQVLDELALVLGSLPLVLAKGQTGFGKEEFDIVFTNENGRELGLKELNTRWKEKYGIELAAICEGTAEEPQPKFYVHTAVIESAPIVTEVPLQE